MKVLLTKEELDTQWQIADFVLKTQQQIAKDFASSGFDFNPVFVDKELSYDQIFNDVSTRLEEVFNSGETTLLQLLYQIDLPQELFLDLLGEDYFLTKLTERIIRREAYKVYLRSLEW